MHKFQDTVGFITGAASGIGLAAAEALGERGMALMLTDIEKDTLQTAAQGLRAKGMEIESAVLDVSDYAAYQAVAKRALERFGKINFLFNNAGVGSFSPAGSTPMADWRWVVNVNLLGVAHGVECILPAMEALSEPCHIVNTASIAGHLGLAGMGPYNATKFAVVGYSESLRDQLAGSHIAISVLCPAFVKTRIAESRRNHPDGNSQPQQNDGDVDVANIIEEGGMELSQLMEIVMDGIEKERFYLFSHPDYWPVLEERLDRIRQDYAAVLASKD